MKKNLNIIPEDADLVLIALNPTIEAIENGAVFSRDKGFWNVLHRAEIIRNVGAIPLERRAMEVFHDQKHSDLKLGFADLLPFLIETNSKKVKVPKDSARDLMENTPNLQKAKRIALLGKKVIDGFASDYNGLKMWKDIDVIDGVKQFGSIGTIRLGTHVIELFAMPFPVNNNIQNKHIFYQMLRN